MSRIRVTEDINKDESMPDNEKPAKDEVNEEQLEQVSGGVLSEKGEAKDKDMEPPLDILPDSPPPPPPPPSR